MHLCASKQEGGRHLPVTERTCFVCDNAVESELHAVIHCPMYSDLRDTFFSTCEEINPQFTVFNDTAKLHYISSAGEIVNISAKFLSLLLKRRRSLIYAM